MVSEEKPLGPKIATISTCRKPAVIGHEKNRRLVISAPGEELWFLLLVMLSNKSNKTKQRPPEMRGLFVCS